MEIETTHHVDASEKKADGTYDHFYEYDLYRFSDSAIAIVARSYKGEPQEAHFLRIERDGKSGLLKVEDLRHALFVQAVNYLKGMGKEELSWLSERTGGYEPLVPTT
jgi:hypothetical protein